MKTTTAPVAASWHHLCFRPLAAATAPRSFCCDAVGHVDLDALDRRERVEYLYARALVGRDFERPCVVGPAASAQ